MQVKNQPSRRGFVLGAATVGAAAAAVATLPAVQTPAVAPQSELLPAPERGGGYQLTEHVKRYYKSTLV